MSHQLSSLRCGVVVVNYHSHHLVAAQLAAMPWLLSAHTVVVDNSEGPGPQEELKRVLDGTPCRYVPAGSNLGFGAACNLGVRNLPPEVNRILFLNPDAALTWDDLERLIAVSKSSSTMMLAPIIRRKDGRIWFSGGSLSSRWGRAYHSEGGSDWLSGACLLVPTAGFADIGGFDESYFLYWEDVDFCTRWLASGRHVAVVPDASAVHDVGGTQAQGSGKSHTYVEHSCRGRLLYARSHLGRAARLRWVIASPLHGWRTARLIAPGSRLPDPAALRSAWRGSIAGLRAPRPRRSQ